MNIGIALFVWLTPLIVAGYFTRFTELQLIIVFFASMPLALVTMWILNKRKGKFNGIVR